MQCEWQGRLAGAACKRSKTMQAVPILRWPIGWPEPASLPRACHLVSTTVPYHLYLPPRANGYSATVPSYPSRQDDETVQPDHNNVHIRKRWLPH